MNEIKISDYKYWPFNALSIKLNNQDYIAIAICLPDNPKTVDVFIYKYCFIADKWQMDYIEDSEYKQISAIVSEYLMLEKPVAFGTDPTKRDLIY